MGNTISYSTQPTTLSLGPKGSILGLQNDQKSRRFAGVPYALPPTGEHRWRKPRPLPPNHTYGEQNEPYDATAFKPVCPQAVFNQVAKAEGEQLNYSEDCLYLNIWTPVPKSGEEVGGKRWPVVLWFHGGWFQMGDPSQEDSMDPTELISTGGLNAVFVAVGYRLNIFGFLAGSALLEESDGEAGGNFGLWDQRAAIEWVKENIHYFGGDPENITLGGRSAGAYGVEAQVLHEFRREKGKGEAEEGSLFKRFYMLSNAIPSQPKTLPEVEGQFDEVCAHFQIPSALPATEKLSRLRQIPSSDLIAALKHLHHHTFRPVTDSRFIHPGMTSYLTSGSFAQAFRARKMKMLIGEVLNEETLYSQYNPPSSPSLEALKKQVGNYYAPATVERILQSYTLPSSETDDLGAWKKVYGDIIADGQVRAPSRFLVKQLAKRGVDVKDVWRYQIAYRMSFITETVAPGWFGVAHAMDRPIWKYVFSPFPLDSRVSCEVRLSV